jgi:hypothetical protein
VRVGYNSEPWPGPWGTKRVLDEMEYLLQGVKFHFRETWEILLR